MANLSAAQIKKIILAISIAAGLLFGFGVNKVLTKHFLGNMNEVKLNG